MALPWARVPDIAWAVKAPHSFFSGRELRTYGMCGHWDLSSPSVCEDGSTWLLPGVQRSLLDVDGDRRVVILKDTARIVMPHAKYSRLDDPVARDVQICLDRSTLQSVSLRVRDASKDGDISTPDLLALVTPLQDSDVHLCTGSFLDARHLPAYGGRLSARRASSVFFHDHALGPPPCLLLVLVAQCGGYPGRRIADFSGEAVAGILLDFGGAGPGLVFCRTGLLTEEAVVFIAQAFASSAAYQAYCQRHEKSTDMRVVDCATEDTKRVGVLDSTEQHKEAGADAGACCGAGSAVGRRIQGHGVRH